MSDGPGPATWPPDATLSDEESVATRCAACALDWRIHRSMAGFKIRCRCGGWVEVPTPPDVRALPGSPTALAESRAAALAGLGDDETAFLAAQPRPRELAGVRGWDGRPLRPDADGSWSLRHAELDTRRKWTNRTALELTAIMLCFLVPALVVSFAVEGGSKALYFPIIEVAASLLVLVVAHHGREVAVQGLRAALARHFVEAVLVAGATALAAWGWATFLLRQFPEARNEYASMRHELGLPLLLFVISFCPGVFEELAFRGLLQGRLVVLMGRVQAYLVTGALFGAAHGWQAGLPFQLGLGVWLSWLRDRSGSLYPGMLAHMLYNAAVVTLLSS